jgi:hypothetical protein
VKKALFFASLSLLASLLLLPSVFALGPEQAVEVANNPNVETIDNGCALETPSHVYHTWREEGKITLWINAMSDKDITRNVAYRIVSGVAMYNYVYVLNQNDFAGEWVYYSGELAGGTWKTQMFQTEGSHGAIYWLHRGAGYSADESLEIAMERPYGAYVRFHFVGNTP